MLICILTATFSANAQLYEVSLDEKIQNASLIVEGRVVAQESYLAPDGHTYTANKVAVSALLKGTLPNEFLTVTTWGGKTENGTVTWTHMLILQPGEEGIFFLERSQVSETTNPAFPSPAFDVFSSSQGFLKFARNGNGDWVAYEPFHIYSNFKDEIFDCVAGKTRHPHVIIDASRSMLHRSGIRYLFKTTSISGSTLNFDIIVNSLYGNKQLHKAGGVLNYNPDFFGSNIATSGNLQLQTNGISANTAYSLTKSNLTSSKVKIELSTTGSTDNLSTLTTTEQTFAKGSLTIVNPFVYPSISFSVVEMYALSKFWEGGSSYEFDTIVVEADFNLHSTCAFDDPPVITSFEPDTCLSAGTNTVLTIRGTCFGNNLIGGSVDFTNSFAGPTPVQWVYSSAEYLEWSDTLIRLYVPSSVGAIGGSGIAYSAGSGFFRVNKGIGTIGIDTSDTPLCIKFSVFNHTYLAPGFNVTSLPVYLGDYNGYGGQSIYFGATFDASQDAKLAFERALIKWRCATKVNYVVQKLSEISDPSKACLVDFLVLPTGTLGATSNTEDPFEPCDSLDYQVGANRLKFVMYFSKNAKWHFDSSTPPLNLVQPRDTFDFESIALHELGHSHLLAHSNNKTDLMYYSYPDSLTDYVRDIKPNDLEGGLYVMKISADLASDSCHARMKRVTGNCAVWDAVIEISPNVEIDLTIFPNPTENTLNVSVDYKSNNPVPLNWTLVDLNGRKVKTGILIESTAISLHNIPSGIYFFNVGTDGSAVKSFKVIKN